MYVTDVCILILFVKHNILCLNVEKHYACYTLYVETSKPDVLCDDVDQSRIELDPVCCKKQQKKFLTSYWFVE